MAPVLALMGPSQPQHPISEQLDLAVVNGQSPEGGSSLLILLGNGDGTFQAPISYPLKTSGASVAAADFNGDGKLDLVVVDNIGLLSVFLGNGDGTFRPRVDYPAGSLPFGSIGAAMRAAPVGLLFADDPELLIRVAHQGRITHKDLRCSAGSVAIAGAVALAASDEIDTPKFVQLTDWLKLPPQQVAPTISCCASADFLDDWKWISPFVIPRVLWSLTAFCEHRKIIGKLFARPVSLAEMWIPLRQWLEPSTEQVNDQGQWGFGELVELPHRCYRIRTAEIHGKKRRLVRQ